MQKIYNEFLLWILGLIEDEPIPYEIKSLVFFINENNEIGFSGSESKDIKKIDYYFYFPLEAQFFYCPILTKSVNIEKTLECLLKKFKQEKSFHNYNIFYGKLFSTAKKI